MLFQQAVYQPPRTRVLVFTIKGCGHCQSYMPKFQAEAARHPYIPVQYIDANAPEAQQLADRLKVEGTPTTVVLRGSRHQAFEGDLDRGEIARIFGLAERYA